MMDNELLRQALSECRARQSENAAEERRRLRKATELCPQIGQLYTARREDIFTSLRSAMDGLGTTDIGSLIQSRNTQIASLLEEHGLDRQYLDAVYSCTLCNDTGYSVSSGKRLCPCVIDRVNTLQNKGILSEDAESFERYDDAVFSESLLAGINVTQRAYMRAVRARCEEYANAVPDASVQNLLLYGGNGLGKTFLLRSIGIRAIQRRVPTLAYTSNALLNRIRKAYFAREPEEDGAHMRVPLLLIDDLGTEPLWENITVEQLFVLVSGRLDSGRHTVISTNLSLSELKSRYTERIMSRLMDERKSRILQFLGEDIWGRKG